MNKPYLRPEVLEIKVTDMSDMLFFCPRWGSESLSWKIFCARVNEAGYDGIEYGIAAHTEMKELEEAWNQADKHGLQMIPQHYDTVNPDFNLHLETYALWFEKIKNFPAIKINSQTGKDYFSFEKNKQLIELGILHGALHETHRGKFSFAAHSMLPYLEKIPQMKLTLDLSHWVCVAESFLTDQADVMQLAVSRTNHIHARVGFTEGPQVIDPRFKEWEYALEQHLYWWDQVVKMKKQGKETITITPEFGSFPYMHHRPGTLDPIADQWEINLFMMNLLRKRYG